MALNPEAVGSTSDPVDATWDSRDALLYAVGIGAGHDELAFTTENTKGIDQLVFPTFPVVIGWGAGSAMGKVGSFDPTQLVHGKQAVTLHQPIPVERHGDADRRDHRDVRQGQGRRRRLGHHRDPRWRTALHDDVVGVHPGRRRMGRRARHRPVRRTCRRTDSPDHEVTYVTSRDQAFVYRLSGDRNPLHTDPGFAAMGGFDTPILHGLCTYGFTGRALLHSLCDSDPSRFQHIEGRFRLPVFPGESLTIRMWARATARRCSRRAPVTATPSVWSSTRACSATPDRLAHFASPPFS